MIESLAYIGIVSPSADEWRTFGPEILGMQLAADSPSGEVRLRLDDKAYRLSLRHGKANDVDYLGWAVDDGGLEPAIAQVQAAGIVVHRGDADLAAERCVDEIAWFNDPFGFRHELCVGLASASSSFIPGRPISSFVTGDGGLGHAVLFVPDAQAAFAFYIDVLGFRLSDEIEMGPMQLQFLHCNERHHTIALAAIPGMRGIHHLMLEVSDLDDVGRAYDLCNDRKLPLAMTFGKHTNDLMSSFYVRTPSGFEVEYGFGGLLVDDATWVVPEKFTAISLWGHKPGAEPLFPGLLHPVASVSA
jgi:extradiol dioxygenase